MASWSPAFLQLVTDQARRPQLEQERAGARGQLSGQQGVVGAGGHGQMTVAVALRRQRPNQEQPRSPVGPAG